MAVSSFDMIPSNYNKQQHNDHFRNCNHRIAAPIEIGGELWRAEHSPERDVLFLRQIFIVFTTGAFFFFNTFRHRSRARFCAIFNSKNLDAWIWDLLNGYAPKCLRIQFTIFLLFFSLFFLHFTVNLIFTCFFVVVVVS